jgi:hypothetical protein
MRTEGYPAYTTSTGWLGYPDDKLRRLCREAIRQGWTAFKMKVGQNLEDNIRRAAIMREEIGPDRKLMMDANQVWEVDEAIESMRELARFDPWWIEEPTSPDDVLGHAAIRAAIAELAGSSDVLLVSGGSSTGPEDHAPSLDQSAGRLAVICSAEASPARISASPAHAPGSTAPVPASSSSSHESLTLFGPAGYSSRTFPDFFPPTVDEISPSFSRRWPSSGMAFAGECWTLDTSESPRDAVACSLSDILEPEVPSRFYLSSRAARGILRRATARGRTLPSHLSAALEAVARTTTTGREDGS